MYFKKVLPAVMASSLMFGLVPNVNAESVDQGEAAETQETSTVSTLNIDGVQVNLVGIEAGSEFYDETIASVQNLIDSEPSGGEIGTMEIPDAASGELFAGPVNNSFITKTYSNIKWVLTGAAGTAAGLIGGVISRNAKTTAAVSAFATAGADAIISSAAPSYNKTYWIKQWSGPFNRSIYNLVTMEYYSESRSNSELKSVTVNGPYDYVNGGFTWARAAYPQ
ncbi:hypothetical protein [Paenibacillus jiagnxiensis]|uniref:hypothetical protein n=1 Tax=Paenibacillus jiagnxiensis TaxID=3228926 RepID=UPI0033A2A179